MISCIVQTVYEEIQNLFSSKIQEKLHCPDGLNKHAEPFDLVFPHNSSNIDTATVSTFHV